MKHYKLIREYPAGPDLGKVITPKHGDGNPNDYYWGGWFNPSDFPEVWEEVEILYTIDQVTRAVNKWGMSHVDEYDVYKFLNGK